MKPNGTDRKTKRLCALAVVFVAAFVAIAASKTVTTVKETQAREGPGAYYRLVTLIPAKTTLDIIETKKSWLKVAYNNNDVWISENSTGAKPAETSADIIGRLPTDNVSIDASPATLTAAIKGFWTRYSRNRAEKYELPVEGYDIPPAAYIVFSEKRATAVDRDRRFGSYRLPGDYKARTVAYEREHSIGFACASAGAEAPLYENQRMATYVNSVASYLGESTERYDMRFIVYILDTDRVNAVSCPGGYIVLTRGLLDLIGDEAELAALLAHEMAHIIAGHGMYEVMENKVEDTANKAFDILGKTVGTTETEQDLLAITDRAISIAESGKGDKNEFEADEMALRYLARSGYDTGSQMRLLQKLMDKYEKNIDMFSLNYQNHPDFGERMKRCRDGVRRYNRSGGETFAADFRDIMGR